VRVVFNFEWGTKFTQGQVDKLNEIIEGTTKLQLEPLTGPRIEKLLRYVHS